MKIKVALFASGSGSNVENIVLYFRNHRTIDVAEVYCNNPTAYVIERCKKLGVPVTIFNRSEFYDSTIVVAQLTKNNIQWVVLAGFLWLIPPHLIAKFPSHMINIHPALLPKYGGKGMYGQNVHKAVVANNEKETGITIHLVNENYDEGRILFQAKTIVEPSDDAEAVAAKIHDLEFRYFPEVIEQTIKG